ncbi:MAG: tetratricopeptide repeat protein [Steroidobacteraceae bacterium]|jgi:tetratricopeptide (TPR) repeat protein
MFFRSVQSRWLPCSLVFAAVILAGCGGAQARKARHLEKGHAFFTAHNYEKARVEFRNALQIAPNDSEARYQNGLVDEKLGNPREAAQFFQGAIDSNADNIQARAALGRLFVLAGVPDRAIEILKPALIQHPDDARLLTVRAAARVQLKDLDGALQDGERAVHLDPASEDAVAVLAGIYKSRGEDHQARELLESAIQRIPNSVDLRLVLAQLYLSLDQGAKAEALLIDLVRLNPSDKAHRLRLAQFYARLNRPDEAEHVLREGIKAFPEDRDLKVSLIDFLAARRSRDAAEKELSRMIASSKDDDYDLRLLQAQFYEQGKDYAKADGVYHQIIAAAKLTPPGITARDRLAFLDVQANKIADAEKLLAEVLDKNPRDNDALILRGNLALAQKDPKTAINDLRSVLRDQPNAVGVMRSLARAHLANGEPALAEETMRRAVDAEPKDPAVRLDLVNLLLQLGKAEQAKPVVDELVKQHPADSAALAAQFNVDAATRNVTDAKVAADALVAAQPKLALGYYEQGKIADAQGRPDDALRLYSTAFDTQPDSSEALESLVTALVRAKRTPEALQRLDATADKYPTLPYALNIKGIVLLGDHDGAGAQAAFQGAIDRQPTWWLPYRGLAAAVGDLEHDNGAAIAALREGIAKASDPQPLQTILASELVSLGKVDDAASVYEEALRANPQSDVAANNLAMLLITYKKDPRSLDRAKTLTTRFANSANPAFLDTYGWVLYKRGESEAAVAALQTVLTKAPDSPTSLYHLGMAQASAGQALAARDSLTRSLKSGKNFAGMDEAKATLDKLSTVGAAIPAQPKT